MMLVAIFVGLASAAACFMALLLLGLEVPLVLACSGAVGCAIFLLALSVAKLISCQKRKSPLWMPPPGDVSENFGKAASGDSAFPEEAPFAPPKTVTLKSKSPEQLDREKRERIIRELEEKNREAARKIAAIKKRNSGE